MIVPCYVVEHPAGSLLWDGGLSSDIAEAGDWVESPPVLLRLDQTLADQLPSIGHALDAFDYVAFSHMHFDHVGVSSEVQGATLLIQQAEFDAAFADSESLDRESEREMLRMILWRQAHGVSRPGLTKTGDLEMHAIFGTTF